MVSQKQVSVRRDNSILPRTLIRRLAQRGEGYATIKRTDAFFPDDCESSMSRITTIILSTPDLPLALVEIITDIEGCQADPRASLHIPNELPTMIRMSDSRC